MTTDPHQRLEGLLIDRAVDGLEPSEHAELEALLAEHGHPDPDCADLAAAWADQALHPEADSPMPAAVAERAERTLTTGEPAPRLEEQPRPRTAPAARARKRRWMGAAVAGWTAAAAALIVALVGWWPGAVSTGPQSPAAARDALLANAPDAERMAWQNTQQGRSQELDGGYVVWSDQRQEGYLTFDGLPPNNSDQHQYQLWIFDGSRSNEFPVDGGVFNARANADGAVVIPIENKLPVAQAKMFAVTLEPPGGVVVSDRDPLLWLAKGDNEKT
jgi:hypothetical protein